MFTEYIYSIERTNAGLIDRFSESLERFPMDCSEPLLVVLLLGHPHLLEGVQGGENGAADPGGVQPLLRGTDPDLNVLGGQLLHLGEQPVSEPFEQGRPTGKNNVLEQNLS